MFLDGRLQLDRNDYKLLATNEHIPLSAAARALQFNPESLGEGSMISFGDGEISVKFPMIAMFHTSNGTAATLKSSSYPVALPMKDESVCLRICCDAVGTHKSWENRGFLCFPLRVRSKRRAVNALETAGVPNAVLWPEVLFRLDNRNTLQNLHRPIVEHALAFGMMFPAFLGIFMPENDVFTRKIEGLDTDIIKRYTPEKVWSDLQNTSCNEKYILIMMLGTSKALELLQYNAVLRQPRKRRLDEPDIKDYCTKDYVHTSAFSTCFSMQSFMKPLYDICYDIFLNILSVATGVSGWQNSDIRRDCAKFLRVQELMVQEPNALVFTHNDTVWLGQQVCFVCESMCRTHSSNPVSTSAIGSGLTVAEVHACVRVYLLRNCLY